ncbi:hypothetical protein A3Q56_07199 [Intoshia linei]|uniref:Cystathionine beta-lyase n=1 Tax=Intoshia linei TaxID=1819745 RepID=A0A177ASS2_9BILA|nr:hypothetical protein A3Q56_07199 [Intoshia linei]
MTHSSVPPAEREKLKISNNFIRLSVGLEEIEDLISDIKFSLDNIDIK